MDDEYKFDPEYLLIGIAIGVTLYAGILLGLAVVYLWVT